VTVHLLKMAVGIDSVAHLAEVQKLRLERAIAPGGTGDLRHFTRHAPRRAGEVAGGGSMFWIIRGYVRVRQRIVGIERVAGREGRKRCALILDPDLVKTELAAHKPIQGWRYLDPGAAPRDMDISAPEVTSIPPDMAAELRALGLL
jgi:hypothetical protein